MSKVVRAPQAIKVVRRKYCSTTKINGPINKVLNNLVKLFSCLIITEKQNTLRFTRGNI
jgi:hypothetical protein